MTESHNTAGPAVRAKADGIRIAGGMALGALRGLEDPAHLIFSIAPSRTHILWLTGHIACALDWMSAGAMGAPVEVPQRFAPLFSIGSQPVPDASHYPPLGELMLLLNRAIEATIARTLALRDEELERPLPEEMPVAKFFPTVGDLLAGAAAHTTYHAGQIALLRRAQGLPSGLGI